MTSPPPLRTLRIARLELRVSDLDGAAAFYCDTLGFTRAEQEPAENIALLTLGGRELALVRAGAAARAYPEPRAANDPWFQHFAIAVSDMDAAFERVRRSNAQPISRGGPQLLPPDTGSVTAYKFRDPEGHPLELSYSPHGAWDAAEAGSGPFLGIDHTALAVRDLEAALEFYTVALGLAPMGRTLNQGPEQDRLDGLASVRVDIVALATARPGPHFELLHYRSPAPAPPRDVASGDVAATHTVVEVGDRRVVADALVTRDPDGHWLKLTEL